MYTRLFLMGIVAIILSFKKENDSLTENKSAAELLTQNPWMLASSGYDENRNGIIDPSEESIEDCQKDNHWYFYPDGTGLFDDNILSCANGINRQPFTWAFINNETGIDFFYDSVLNITFK
jgi:hypothetical protein